MVFGIFMTVFAVIMLVLYIKAALLADELDGSLKYMTEENTAKARRIDFLDKLCEDRGQEIVDKDMEKLFFESRLDFILAKATEVQGQVDEAFREKNASIDRLKKETTRLAGIIGDQRGRMGRLESENLRLATALENRLAADVEAANRDAARAAKRSHHKKGK
jgi:hypothetical protein